MRSISYAVFGKGPKNMDDCIDYYLRKHESNKKPSVSLKLSIETDITEQYTLDHLVGYFLWEFSDGTKVEYEKIYGGIFQHKSNKRQVRSIDNANKRLHSDLEVLHRLGIDVNLTKRYFDDL